MKKTYHLWTVAFAVLVLASCGPSAPPPAETPEVVRTVETPSSAESVPAPASEPVKAPEVKTPEVKKPAPPQKTDTSSVVAKTSEPAPVETPVPAAPAAPPPAPDLQLEPSSALQSGTVLVRTAALPAGTVVKYTLDGTDPSNGKAWPAAGLSVAQSSRLRVWAAQPGGDASTVEAAYTVGEIWVQPGASGDGSWTRPAGTIEDALVKAGAAGVKRLRLMSGQWTTKIELTGTWELSGGWKAPGEPGGASIVVGSKQTGATQKEPSFTLKAAKGARLILTGLELRSPNSSFATALQVESDATVDIIRSRLVGGNGLYGYGLRATAGSSVVIADSSLYGGDGGSTFALSAEKSSVKALRSTFDAGTGDAVSYGLNVTLSKLTLISSVVWGGAANSSYGVGLYSSEGSVIQASTILGGKGASSWALYLSESDPEIASCLIGSTGKSKSYGIFSNYGKSLPKSLRSNGFFGSAAGAFTGADLGAVSDPSDAGAFLDASGRAFSNQKGNFRAEPALGAAPDFRLLASSPAALLKGGEALAGDAALDRGGRPRGTAPAVGAWAISP